MSQVRRGDIFEIGTPRGLAYFQVIHRDRMHGHLIRVLDWLSELPANLTDLTHAETRFMVFFPVGHALKEDIIRRVGRGAIPAQADPFPVMKVPGLRDKAGHVEKWWLWNGVEEWPVESLTPEQAKFPTAAVINDTLLIEYIVGGWKHEDDVR